MHFRKNPKIQGENVSATRTRQITQQLYLDINLSLTQTAAKELKKVL